MSTLFLLFSHKLTPTQVKEAKTKLNINHIIYLPTHLQNIWSNIPPEIEDITPLLEPIKKWLILYIKENDYILIQGDFGATCHMVKFAFDNKTIPIYATTKRKSIEKKIDGKIIKESIFEHSIFRRYK